MSVSQRFRFDPSAWQRHGRGRELQFFATDQDVLRYLSEFTGNSAFYYVVGSRLVSEGKRYRDVGFVLSLKDVLVSISRSEQPPTQFWLAGDWPDGLPLPSEIDDWCATNGLILVQHGDERSGKRLESRISLVDKITNADSGELIEFEEERKRFDSLRRTIRRDLAYATIQVFADGHEEDDQKLMMTSAAADLPGAFSRRPSRGSQQHGQAH